MTLSGEAVGVPLVYKLKLQTELPHVELRVVLFDLAQKVLLSNFYTLGVETLRKPVPKN